MGAFGGESWIELGSSKRQEWSTKQETWLPSLREAASAPCTCNKGAIQLCPLEQELIAEHVSQYVAVQAD